MQDRIRKPISLERSKDRQDDAPSRKAGQKDAAALVRGFLFDRHLLRGQRVLERGTDARGRHQVVDGGQHVRGHQIREDGLHVLLSYIIFFFLRLNKIHVAE